jgi:biopolymer transport protein ExbD
MEREVNQINVIPLVDVMLVLLVIVLTTATFISTAGGQLFLNDHPVPGGGLPAQLQSYKKESAVVVRADRVTLLEQFVGVVDEVRSLGFRQVSLEVVRL